MDQNNTDIPSYIFEADKTEKIRCDVSNNFYSCSTIILHSFPSRYGDYRGYGKKVYPIHPVNGKPGDNPFSTKENASFEAFLKDLMRLITKFNESQTDNYNDATFNSFAFVTASVRSEQGLISQYLDRLGFMSTSWVYNTKNKSDVRFFIMPIPEFIEVIEEFTGEPFPKGVKETSKWSEKNLNDWDFEEVIETEGSN